MADNHAETENLPTYKIILLGQVDAGKTTLFYYFRDGRFVPSDRYGPGADYCAKTMTVDNDKVKLILWDTAGVERYRTLTRNYFRGACAAILAYNTANKESLQNLVPYIEDTDENAPKALRYLVGCKCDLPNDKNLSERDAQNFAQAHGCRKIFMTSSKTGIGVDEAIAEIAQEVHTLHKMKRDSVCGETPAGGFKAIHHGFYSASDKQDTLECGC